MKKEIQDATVNLSVKTIATVGTVLFLMVGEYIVLTQEIEEAKLQPKPEITKLEFEFGIEKLQKSIEINLKEIEELKQEILFIEENYQKSRE
tara:strand:- start:46 stop:321 length:276 start_codon:yes stop_codon:yes gene_type:complete